MNDLRKCLASGHKARLVRARNEECEYPLREKNVNTNFRNYHFSVGYATSINDIKNNPNLTEFEKQLTLNYVSCYGDPDAVKSYYETGILTKRNVRSSMGVNHLVHVDDLIKFYKSINDTRAVIYERQYRAPEHVNDVQHFFDFYRCNTGSTYSIRKFKRKLWVVDMLDKDCKAPRTPLLVYIISALVFPLKYVPSKSVLRMPEYTIYGFRIGSVVNGFEMEFHIPKKFSFK